MTTRKRTASPAAKEKPASKKNAPTTPKDHTSHAQKQARRSSSSVPAVTPSTAVHNVLPTEAADVTNGSVARSLFSSPVRPVEVTPSKASAQPESPAKRKLIFGRPSVEIVVQDAVRKVYKTIKKRTGSIGGNASFGPIYGELTMGSMQKIINVMKEHTGFCSSSRFIDVGSGIGKPNLHVSIDPGVEFSYGIEVEHARWLLSMNCLQGAMNDIDGNCLFEHGDIKGAKIFDPFTHVYMFSIGFPPKLWCELSNMWNRSSSQYLICYHGPKDIIGNYEFQVELLVQIPTSMHGSKEGHMGYVYQRCGKVGSTEKQPQRLVVDPYFARAWELVKGNPDALKDEVDQKLLAVMESGTRTRSKRR